MGFVFFCQLEFFSKEKISMRGRHTIIILKILVIAVGYFDKLLENSIFLSIIVLWFWPHIEKECLSEMLFLLPSIPLRRNPTPMYDVRKVIRGGNIPRYNKYWIKSHLGGIDEKLWKMTFHNVLLSEVLFCTSKVPGFSLKSIKMT